MSLYFILKMAGDLSLLYAAANAFFCMTSCDVSFLPLLVLSCCGGLGLFLNSKKPILRYLALLPAPLAFFGVNSTFTGVIILISVGYLAVIVHRQNFALTYDDRLGFLSLSIKVLVACLIPILTFAWGELPRFIPFVILLFICTLILTQAHDMGFQTTFFGVDGMDGILTLEGFDTSLAEGLMCSALLALLVVLFSSSWFINLLLQLPYLFYRWVIAPIIMLIALVVGGALMLLFSPLQDKIRSFLSQIYDQFVGRLNAPLQELPENMEAEAPFQLLDYLSPLFTLAISIAGLILLVRLIKRNRHRFQPSNAKETRTTVSGSRYFEAAAPADLFPPSEPRKAVRYYYRCFLRTCQKMGVFFPSSADSQTIEQQSQKFFRPESLGQLRQVRRVYIKARYSDDPVQEQDVQQIKSAYEYLKDEQEEMDKR